jgi:hypothetical protein
MQQTTIGAYSSIVTSRTVAPAHALGSRSHTDDNCLQRDAIRLDRESEQKRVIVHELSPTVNEFTSLKTDKPPLLKLLLHLYAVCSRFNARAFWDLNAKISNILMR